MTPVERGQVIALLRDLGFKVVSVTQQPQALRLVIEVNDDPAGT
jgi:hypothetical protein